MSACKAVIQLLTIHLLTPRCLLYQWLHFYLKELSPNKPQQTEVCPTLGWAQ